MKFTKIDHTTFDFSKNPHAQYICRTGKHKYLVSRVYPYHEESCKPNGQWYIFKPVDDPGSDAIHILTSTDEVYLMEEEPDPTYVIVDMKEVTPEKLTTLLLITGQEPDNVDQEKNQVGYLLYDYCQGIELMLTICKARSEEKISGVKSVTVQ